ncbi:ABC transporter ATP-binding protein [Streptomyces sp. SID3343]|uniref:ABC transporter ATP-binding protein n=1 Tax=Streptomyces sp. SID3343 TaxID=2690260 RepID=UPI0031F95066
MSAAGSLVVDGLTVRFRLPRAEAEVRAVSDVSFSLAAGECLALVGESGCGKSVMAAALLGLLPANAWIGGRATLIDDDDAELELVGAAEGVLAREVRGRRIGLVPQSPAAHLTPVRTVRSQLEETVRELLRSERAQVRTIAEGVAERAAYPVDHLDRYPHELSGGLAQRAAVALALVGDPWLIVADEPTTGLDRALVERTADELRRLADAGHAVLLVTHDLAAAERIADRVAVMYAGRIVEVAPAAVFFGDGPRHPYARGLLAALPEREFVPIPGMPPELTALPQGCVFAARCGSASTECTKLPVLVDGVACHHPEGVGCG